MKKKELAPAETETDLRARFLRSLNAANKREPPPGALDALEAVIADCKRAGVTAWDAARDPLEAVLFTVLEVEAPKYLQHAIPKVWKEHAREFMEGLGGSAAAPLERSLIHHAAVCWVRLGIMEIYYTAANVADGNTLEKLEHVERRLMLAQRRFARAVETLSRVRMMQAATRLIESRIEKRIGGSVHQLKAAS